MHRLVSYDGGTLGSDSNNSANTIVERDGNGTINASSLTLAAGGALKNAAASFAPGNAFTGNSTLSNASPKNCECDATSGNFTLTLPPVSASAGQEFSLVKIDSSAHTVGFNPTTDPINGNATPVTTGTQWATLKLRANAAGTNWLLG